MRTLHGEPALPARLLRRRLLPHYQELRDAPVAHAGLGRVSERVVGPPCPNAHTRLVLHDRHILCTLVARADPQRGAFSRYEGLDIATQVASDHYRPAANRYGVRSGRTLGSKDAFGLDAWEQAGWIIEQDPYGWFQWYCRFFLGRRSMDDDRQVGRWGAMCGEKGRWKRNLVARCLREGKAHDDVSCAPVVRQTLQHWAYRLTEADFASYRAKIAAGAKAPFMPSELMPSVSLDSQGAVETQGQSSSPAGVNGEENGRKKKVLASKAAPAAIGADAASGSDRAKRAWAPELCAEPCDASGSASVGDEKKRKRGRKRN